MLSHKVTLGSSGTKIALAYCHTVAARLHPNQLPSVAGEVRQKIYDRFPCVLGNSKTTDVHATFNLLRRSAQTDVAVHMAPCFYYLFTAHPSLVCVRLMCTHLLTSWRKKQFGQMKITFLCTQVPLLPIATINRTILTPTRLLAAVTWLLTHLNLRARFWALTDKRPGIDRLANSSGVSIILVVVVKWFLSIFSTIRCLKSLAASKPSISRRLPRKLTLILAC